MAALTSIFQHQVLHKLIFHGRFKSYEGQFFFSKAFSDQSSLFILIISTLSELNDEYVALGITTIDPVYRNEIQDYDWSDLNTIVYRPYNGMVYPSRATLEKSHINDIISFVFSPNNVNLQIFKVKFKFKSQTEINLHCNIKISEWNFLRINECQPRYTLSSDSLLLR